MPVERKQRDVIERFLLSVTAYALCVAIAWIAKFSGLTRLSYEALTAGSLVILAYVIGVYLVYRTGLNRSIEDSLFTRLQMLVAIGWISLFVWSAEELRGAMLMIYLFVAMFSFFTLSPRQTAGIGLLISTIYGALIGLDWWRERPDFNLIVNVVQWCILSAALLWSSSISAYLSGVRQKMRSSTQLVRSQSAELSRTNRELETALARLGHLAVTDELTGLSNRRHFLSTVNAHMERSRNEQFGFGVCLLDLDHFKRVNDTYGHLAGSQVLREVGQLLDGISQKREAIAARYGGDEFVIAASGIHLEEAIELAEEVREAIVTSTFCAQPGEVQPDVLNLTGITCSIGVASLQRHVSTESTTEQRKSTLLRLSDAAMYVAKETGRNRTVVAGQPVQPRVSQLHRFD